MVIVSIDGRVEARRDLLGGRRTFDFHIALPQRAVRLTVIAVVDENRQSSTTVAPVFGLPRIAGSRAPPQRERLGREIRGLARGFPGLCGIFVRDLRTGSTATWNARAEFPAASTLKVAIAIEVMRALRGKPQPGSTVDRLLRKMLIPSDDKAANALLTWLGGSTSGGSARVNAMVRAVGLHQTDMYGGYEVQAVGPSFVGKRTTAWDFGRLLHYLHLAADGKGRLAERFRGSFVPADARFLLYLLAQAQPNWLDRHLPRGQVAVLHKPGWNSMVRHDAGLVYSPRGALVVVVMTWHGSGAADRLIARVARAAYTRLNRPSPKSAGSRRPPNGRPTTSPPPRTRGRERLPPPPSRDADATGRGTGGRPGAARRPGRGTGSRPGSRRSPDRTRAKTTVSARARLRSGS
jgi:Beta-lactamase enzyme family